MIEGFFGFPGVWVETQQVCAFAKRDGGACGRFPWAAPGNLMLEGLQVKAMGTEFDTARLLSNWEQQPLRSISLSAQLFAPMRTCQDTTLLAH